MKYYLVLVIVVVIIYKLIIEYMVIVHLKKYHAEDRLLKISVKKKIWNIGRLAMGKDYWLIRCCYPMIIEKKKLFCIFRNNLRIESILILTLMLLFLFISVVFGIVGMIKIVQLK